MIKTMPRIKTLEGKLKRRRVWIDPNEPEEWKYFIKLNYESLYVCPAKDDDTKQFDFIVVLRSE